MNEHDAATNSYERGTDLKGVRRKGVREPDEKEGGRVKVCPAKIKARDMIVEMHWCKLYTKKKSCYVQICNDVAKHSQHLTWKAMLLKQHGGN